MDTEQGKDQFERILLMHQLERWNEEYSTLSRTERAEYKSVQKRFLALCKKRDSQVQSDK